MSAPETQLFWAIAWSLVIFVILLAKMWRVLHRDLIVEGDVACDEMLLDRIRHAGLLVGHYSRFGFYHPGPFFFYLRYAGEWLAGPLFPGPYEAHLAGLLAGNALFIGLAAMAAQSLAGGGRGGWLAAAGTVAVVFYQFHDATDGILYSWMPDVVRMPYFAFLLQALLLARGSAVALVAASFCAAAAIHGYATMPLFVGPVWLWAVGLGHWRRHKLRTPWPWAALTLTFVVIAAFLAPMAIDAIVNPPGNIAAILAQLGIEHDLNDFTEALDHLGRRWGAIHRALWLLPVAALLLDWRGGQGRSWLLPLGMAAASTALFLVYLWTAPGGLYDYIGYFHESMPLALISFGMVRLAPHLAARRWTGTATIGLAAAAIVLGGGKASYAGLPEVSVMTQAILAASPARTVALDIADHDLWPIEAALMVDLQRRGWSACARRGTLFGLPERLCGEADERPRLRIIRQEDCGGKCLAVTFSAGVIEETSP